MFNLALIRCLVKTGRIKLFFLYPVNSFLLSFL